MTPSSGAMFSDSDIRNELQKTSGADLEIQNYCEDSITPVGYDVRAGETVFSLKKKRVISLDSGIFELASGDTAFILSYESFKLSENIGGICVSRLGPQLQNVFYRSMPLDPTWNGKLIAVLTNSGKKPFTIKYKDRLITACFFKMQSPSVKEVARERLDNENIRKMFREMEKSAKSSAPKIWLIDLGVITAIGILAYTMRHLNLISDSTNAISLAIAAIAIYYSKIRENFE